MGFQEQLQEILGKLNDNRQTLLFSATLPQSLVDFAKAGLQNPQLVRLDAELQISPNLQVSPTPPPPVFHSSLPNLH
jgi:ATP-dependent RNA helicase DDX54/DBP10